jgi:hypothetical protein
MTEQHFHFVDFDIKDLLDSEKIPFDELPADVQNKRSRLREIVGSNEWPLTDLETVVKNGETPLEDILRGLSIGDEEKDGIRAEAGEATGNYYNPDNPALIMKCYASVNNNWGPGVRVCRLVRNPNFVPDS